MHRESRELKTFLANQVSKIHQLSSHDQWHHIASGQNPADVLPRGLLPEEIRDNSLWWHGPELLQQSAYSTIVIGEPTQRDDFNCELRVFIDNCRSKLKRRGPLTMSEDDKGVLRVGGRFEKASIPYSQRHPAILAKNSKLSKIYFITLHKKLFHVGPQGLLNAIKLLAENNKGNSGSLEKMEYRLPEYSSTENQVDDREGQYSVWDNGNCK
ncbi:integrase catalytic domain-containing protein [Trichonephila clavipes]|nr:integrase catalytic domain-containing protein [Trichonephila clavipes]